MNDPKQNSLDDSKFYRELALTSRAYKSADGELPPPAMDDAIRAAARRAVKSQPHAMGKSWIVRNSAPLSAAALVMLTVSIGFIALDERPELAPALVSEGVRPGVTAPASTAMRAPETAGPEVMQSPRGLPAVPTAEKKAMRERSTDAPQDRLVESAKTDSVSRPNEAAVAAPVAALAKDANIASALERQVVAPAPAAAAAPAPAPVVQEAPVFVADPAPVAATRREKLAENTALSKQEMSQERQAIGSIAGAGPAARNDAPRPAQKTAAQAPAPATTAPAVASSSAVAPPTYAPPAPPASMADKADGPPEKWLKRILELKQAGKTREFEVELVKFRKRYPDYALPAALTAQK